MHLPPSASTGSLQNAAASGEVERLRPVSWIQGDRRQRKSSRGNSGNGSTKGAGRYLLRITQVTAGLPPRLTFLMQMPDHCTSSTKATTTSGVIWLTFCCNLNDSLANCIIPLINSSGGSRDVALNVLIQQALKETLSRILKAYRDNPASVELNRDYVFFPSRSSHLRHSSGSCPPSTAISRQPSIEEVSVDSNPLAQSWNRTTAVSSDGGGCPPRVANPFHHHHVQQPFASSVVRSLSSELGAAVPIIKSHHARGHPRGGGATGLKKSTSSFACLGDRSHPHHVTGSGQISAATTGPGGGEELVQTVVTVQVGMEEVLREVVAKLCANRRQPLVLVPSSVPDSQKGASVLPVAANSLFIGIPSEDGEFSLIQSPKEKAFVVAAGLVSSRNTEQVQKHHPRIFEAPSEGVVILLPTGEVHYASRPTIVLPSQAVGGSVQLCELPMDLTSCSTSTSSGQQEGNLTWDDLISLLWLLRGSRQDGSANPETVPNSSDVMMAVSNSSGGSNRLLCEFDEPLQITSTNTATAVTSAPPPAGIHQQLTSQPPPNYAMPLLPGHPLPYFPGYNSGSPHFLHQSQFIQHQHQQQQRPVAPFFLPYHHPQWAQHYQIATSQMGAPVCPDYFPSPLHRIAGHPMGPATQPTNDRIV